MKKMFLLLHSNPRRGTWFCDKMNSYRYTKTQNYTVTCTSQKLQGVPPFVF